MNKTKIEWADATWNPVTGCLHGCEYCYARRIATRFKGCDKGSTYGVYCQAIWRRVNPDSKPEDALFEIDEKCPPINVRFESKTQKNVITRAPYPWGFQPTLHRERLNIPAQWTKPRTIFVCSMADLFGNWVPTAWIRDVLDACERTPRHQYLFLTKNTDRYLELDHLALLPHLRNFWYGTTVTSGPVAEAAPYPAYLCGHINTFWSVEPMLGPVSIRGGIDVPNWVIIGAETGNRKGKITPKKEWIDALVKECVEWNIPVFMKDSLIPIVGEANMRRDFPWEVRR